MASRKRNRRKQAKSNEFVPGTVVLSLMPEGSGGCGCPICEVLGIEADDSESRVVATPIETREQWEALQAAYTAFRLRSFD